VAAKADRQQSRYNHLWFSFFLGFRGAVMADDRNIGGPATKVKALLHLTGLLHCSERWQAGPLA
jgi:hypothetical protein